jgi:hypothetical protein
LGRRVRPHLQLQAVADGLTDIDVVVVREGKTLKGRFLGIVLGTVGKGVLEKAFVNSVKAIEARNGVTNRVTQRDASRSIGRPGLEYFSAVV